MYATGGQQSYAYTKQENVSPLRPARVGESNIPMSYNGPPNAAERRRNAGRRDQSRSSFEFGNGNEYYQQINDHPAQQLEAQPTSEPGVNRRRKQTEH